MYEYHYEMIRISEFSHANPVVINRLNELGSEKWKLVSTYVENNKVYLFFIRKVQEDVVLLEEQEVEYKGLTQ